MNSFFIVSAVQQKYSVSYMSNSHDLRCILQEAPGSEQRMG